ncbi:MAG TPA: hypothetical protein VGE26_01170 [Sphingobacteriaceae bacterium]
MSNELRNKLRGALVVPVGLMIILIPFSMLIGWNLITALLFWFVFTPALAIYLPGLVSSNKDHLVESVAGLMIFYGFIVFMIFDHYKSDLFRVMVMSGLINLVMVSAIPRIMRPRTCRQ